MKSYIKYIFGVFGMLAAVDLLFLIYSNGYRDVFGQVSGISGVMWRIIPDVVMVLFYGFIFWKLKKGIFLPRLMILHGVIFSLLGVVICLPWAGYFFAPFSPIGLLFMASIIWVKGGYYLSLAITLMFIAFNIYLVRSGLADRRLGDSANS